MMCPLMSFFATLFFKDSHNANFFAIWVQTTALNYPAAFLWQLCGAGPLVRFVFGKGLAARTESVWNGTFYSEDVENGWEYDGETLPKYVVRVTDTNGGVWTEEMPLTEK